MSALSFVSIDRPAFQVVMGAPLFLVLIFGAGWILYRLIEKGGEYIGKAIELRLQTRADRSIRARVGRTPHKQGW